MEMWVMWYTVTVYVGIAAYKNYLRSFILNALRRVIARRFSIIGYIESNETADVLVFYDRNAIKSLRLIRPFIHHPLRRLRAELILTYYDSKISYNAFMKLYNTTKYKLGEVDVKHNNALEILVRAAPQTHTHEE